MAYRNVCSGPLRPSPGNDWENRVTCKGKGIAKLWIGTVFGWRPKSEE